MIETSDTRDCTTCRWGDMGLKGKHVCWGLERAEAEICRENEYGQWEPKKEAGAE